MLNNNASINFYMFYGGTNFGFTAGANDLGVGGFNADITSYDYDAPMDEAGDPTPKYMLIRDTIKEYLSMPNIPVPDREQKMNVPSVQMSVITSLLSNIARRILGTTPINSVNPLTFEEINQYSGFVLYETYLPDFKIDPSSLIIPKLRDRALVFIDNVSISICKSNINMLPKD